MSNYQKMQIFIKFTFFNPKNRFDRLNDCSSFFQGRWIIMLTKTFKKSTAIIFFFLEILLINYQRVLEEYCGDAVTHIF